MPPKRSLDHIRKPGDFKLLLDGEDRRIVYACPRGKGLCGVAIAPSKLPNGASWTFDGNMETPTLSPSINCVGGCGWHGFVTAGEWRSV